ncbi:murein hydrolase activator EnvC family protein [Pelobacter seleniigenes]|uniref:murein hydrolase activator EnvC family protein n=1 Tax=Pelobacter seleniigenes TaxID=407188 RepID=UPI0004A6F82B|nr:peptidoglycan DD-metalloendopeptidase family protein [Pelobacter seleniigenes]
MRCLVIFIFLFLAAAVIVDAADLDENRLQLDKIKSRIEQAQKALDKKSRTELDLSRELALLKKNLDRIEQRIVQLRKEQAALSKKAQNQQAKINASQQVVRTSRHNLEKRLVALYKEGDAGALKILFSADSPTEMVQQYHYLTLVLQEDVALLDDYRSALENERQQLAHLEALEKSKAVLLAKEQEQKKVADEARQLQAQLLGQARADKQQLSSELAALKDRERRLKQLVEQLESRERETAPPPSAGVGAGSFAVGQGKLGWPVNGRVIIGFGTQKDSKLGTFYESNGIEIAVSPGTPIHAVATGKVVFADYFKGYGNLYILSHPGGYHTLYAQTDRMQKKLGDHVAAGDLLGYSGLAGRESIYFEIRSKGSPVNPLTWLKKR